MQPPNQLMRTLTDAYIRYLLSAHPLHSKDPELSRQVAEELNRDGILARGPIVELDRAPLQAETVRQLVEEGLFGERFLLLEDQDKKRKLDPDRPLYSHQ